MLVFIVLILALVAVPIVAILLAVGPAGLEAFAHSMANITTINPLAISLGLYLVLIPFLAIAFVVIGSIYGISKEVVETGKTSAESAFSWLRHHFLSFAGAGVIISLIVLAPQLLVMVTVSYFFGYTVTGWASFGSSLFVFVYSFITLGLTSMVMPAVVSGKGVQEAVKESFRLATQRFDRVFGIHTAIILFALITFSPFLALAAISYFYPLSVSTLVLPAAAALGGYAVVIGFAWILVFFPMTFIAYVRVYNALTGGEIAKLTTPVAEVPVF
jgi:hypothetical protein